MIMQTVKKEHGYVFYNDDDDLTLYEKHFFKTR